jgi:hypothetical protein
MLVKEITTRNQSKMGNKYLDEIMNEMFRRVGLEYKEDKVKEQDWFLQASWTEEEQNDFKEWFVTYLSNNKSAIEDLYENSLNNKQLNRERAAMFVFNYGWKLKE